MVEVSVGPVKVKADPDEIQRMMGAWSDAVARRGGVFGWLRRICFGDEGPRIKDVLAIPVAVSAHEGKLYVRMCLIGGRQRFKKGNWSVTPSVRCAIFPHIASGIQVQPTEIDGVDERFLTVNDVDPHYRIVFRLPGYGAEEISKNVWQKPHSMAALVSGSLTIEAGKKKYEVAIVPLSLSLGNGILNPHDGPLVRPKEGK